MNTYHKRFLVVLAILGAIAAVACQKPQPVSPGQGGGVPASEPATIEVVFVQGQALVDGKPTEVGTRLDPRFTVTTGPDSRCDIVLDGGNVLSIGQNAFADFDLSAGSSQVRLKKGGLTSVLKKLKSLVAKDSFQVITEAVSAGVRGTSFCVWADDRSTYICACNGVVHALDANGSNEETLESAHHVARLFTREGTAITKEPAGMIHHTDATVESAAARIGYAIDWTKVDR